MTGNIIPTMRYRDVTSVVEWLCDAFGFEKHLVVPEDGTIAHAQLTLGDGMIMLGSLNENEYGQLIKQPSEVGGETQAPYIVVADIDAHYERAKRAGAEILLDLAEQDYGGRLYTCRDPEGHIWNFGSYNPWAESTSET